MLHNRFRRPAFAAALLAATGLGETEPPVEGDVLAHRLVGREPERVEASRARHRFGAGDQRAAETPSLVRGVDGDLCSRSASASAIATSTPRTDPCSSSTWTDPTAISAAVSAATGPGGRPTRAIHGV